MKFIEFKDVTKTYSNGITACADVSVQIDKGEFVFVIGLTASGKSTFVKMLYREEKPTKGTVMVGGVNVGKLKNRKVYAMSVDGDVKSSDVISAVEKLVLYFKTLNYYLI